MKTETEPRKKKYGEWKTVNGFPRSPFTFHNYQFS